MRLRQRFVFVIAASTCLSACSHPDRRAYDAAMTCLTNEVAWHAFVDQTYDPAAMLPEDRRRVEILRSRAVGAGQAIGISPERTYGDTWQQAEKLIAEDQKEEIGDAAVQRVMRARACLARPGGSAHLN